MPVRVPPLDVSLVIPVRNETAKAAMLVESVACQSFAPAEVVVVDGGSTDGTAALVRELTAHDPRFQVVEAGDATPGRGRNVGIAQARHGWVALTDAGIRLEPQWLERLVEAAQDDSAAGIVYGNVEPFVRTQWEEWSALAHVPPKYDRPGGKARGPSVASMLLKKSAWEAVGGFPDCRAVEDIIFMDRLAAAGIKAVWAPGATVWWELRPDPVGTFRKFALYSKVNAWAGYERRWHHGVARMYLAGLPFFMLAVCHRAYWLAIPALMALARVVKSVWTRREGRGLTWVLRPVRLVGVGLVLITIDAAMFWGWGFSLFESKPAAVLTRLDEA